MYNFLTFNVGHILYMQSYFGRCANSRELKKKAERCKTIYSSLRSESKTNINSQFVNLTKRKKKPHWCTLYSTHIIDYHLLSLTNCFPLFSYYILSFLI